MSEPYLGNSASDGQAGVSGVNSAPAGVGVWGESATGRGVVGVSTSGVGAWGHTGTGRGVVGAVNGDGAGVWGETKTGRGVVGVVNGGDQNGAGVWGECPGGTGVVAAGLIGLRAEGKQLAARFVGVVEVSGDVRLVGADCAEQFDVTTGPGAGPVEPGTVLVIGDTGALEPSSRAHDRRVAGVVSGAGKYRPGIVLDSGESAKDKATVALVGKVYCKVDASFGPVAVGDLLTTSPTPGHAMRATDPALAFGAVLGKALTPLSTGQALVPILVTLQ